MRLSTAAIYFDKEIFTGVVETDITFNGQLRVFADETSSGSSRGRRVLSVAPDITLPTDFLISHADGKKYLLGKYAEEDYWHGSVIRKKHTAAAITDTAQVGTIGNVLADTLATDLYIVSSPLSTFSERVEASEKYHRVRFLFSATSSVARGGVIKSGADYFFTINHALLDPAGFNFIDANLLEDPVTTADFTFLGSTYDPESDTYSTSADTGVDVFQIPAITDYNYEGLDSEKVVAGDLMVSVLKADVAAVGAGDTVAVGLIDYSVMNVIDHTTYWTLLVRK